MQTTDTTKIELAPHQPKKSEYKLAEFIAISGREFTAPFRFFKREELLYDGVNPRLLWHIKNQRGGKPFEQPEVYNFLWLEYGDRLLRLMKGIEKNLGIRKPVFVKQLSNGLWVVLEGNRRLASVDKLRLGGQKIWNDYLIPAYCLPADMTKLDLDIWMADEHVSPKEPWSAWARSLRIVELKAQNLTNADIAAHLQRSEKDIETVLLTMPMMDEISKLNPAEDAESLYSQSFEYTKAMTNCGRNPEAAKVVLNDPVRKKIVAEVIGGGHLDTNKEARDLAKIMKNPRSVQKLITGNGLDRKTFEKAKVIAKADDNRSNFMKEVPKFFNKLLENRQVAVENLIDSDSSCRESWQALRVLINEISTGASLPPARNRKGPAIAR